MKTLILAILLIFVTTFAQADYRAMIAVQASYIGFKAVVVTPVKPTPKPNPGLGVPMLKKSSCATGQCGR